MSYNYANSSQSELDQSKTSHVAKAWRILGRSKIEFVKQMKPFASCPADVYYQAHDAFSQRFARDLWEILSEAGWNVTLGTDSRRTVGIRVVTQSPMLHAREIAHLVKSLRGADLEAKVRVRSELETEAIQIVIGSKPNTL